MVGNRRADTFSVLTDTWLYVSAEASPFERVKSKQHLYWPVVIDGQFGSSVATFTHEENRQ